MSPHLQLQKKKIMIKKMVFSDGMAGMYQKPVAWNTHPRRPRASYQSWGKSKRREKNNWSGKKGERESEHDLGLSSYRASSKKLYEWCLLIGQKGRNPLSYQAYTKSSSFTTFVLEVCLDCTRRISRQQTQHEGVLNVFLNRITETQPSLCSYSI